MPTYYFSHPAMRRLLLTFTFLLSVLPQAVVAQEKSVVLHVADGLFDKSRPATLGLSKPPAIRYHSVVKAAAGGAQYNHGTVLFAFKNRLYVQWQSSSRDEDQDDTRVLFSSSVDGAVWSAPQLLAPARKDALVTNGGWWRYGDTLVAFLNVWPNGVTPKGGHVEYISSADGATWTAPKRLLDRQGKPLLGVIEQDLRALPNGRILTALHAQPGLIARPLYTDDPSGLTGWTEGRMENLPHQPGMSRELEPSWFLNARREPVMVFRDQASSFTVLASLSRDNGESWSTPVATNMPDARAKQSAGNLPTGAPSCSTTRAATRTAARWC